MKMKGLVFISNADSRINIKSLCTLKLLATFSLYTCETILIPRIYAFSVW